MKYVALAQRTENKNRIDDLIFGITNDIGDPNLLGNFDIFLSEIFIGFNIFNDEHFFNRKFTGNSNTNMWVVGKEDLFDNIEDARKKLIRDILK